MIGLAIVVLAVVALAFMRWAGKSVEDNAAAIRRALDEMEENQRG